MIKKPINVLAAELTHANIGIIFMKGNRLQIGPGAFTKFILLAVGCLLQTLAFCGQTSDTKLNTFRKFVNGEVPVKEAIVYRKISKPDGTVLNQEWWRFAFQAETWYVQRIEPDKEDPSKLVPLPRNRVCGASLTELWTVSETDVHVAEKVNAVESKPATFGELSRNLMFCALSLGVPRRLDVLSINLVPVEWDGLTFTTVVATKRDKMGKVLATGSLKGNFVLGSHGLPVSIEYPERDEFQSGSVSYDYRPDTTGIPSSFVVKYSGKELRYQFLSLVLGTNDVKQAGGYLPGMFAENKLERHLTFWTNGLAYSFINSKFQPAFGVHQTRYGTIIFASLGLISAVILALWYRRR